MKLKVTSLNIILSVFSATLFYSTFLGTIVKAQVGSNMQGSEGKQFQPAKNAQDHFQRGRDLDKADLIQEALVEYSRAIELDSNYMEAYFYRGNLLVVSERYQEAIRDLQRVAEFQHSIGNKESASSLLQFIAQIQQEMQENEPIEQEVQEDEP